MFKRIRESILVISIVAALCLMFAACGASEGGFDDVDCDIGIVAHGNQYTATVKVTDSSWEELTDVEKNNVVDQCLETVDFSRDGDDDGDFELTAFEKDTKKPIFSYRSEDGEIIFSGN